MALAMHDRPSGTAAYQSWPAPSTRPTPGSRIAAAARSPAGREGLALMTRAVAACRTTAFSGIEVSRWWGPAGPRVWLAKIWHQPGAVTVAQPLGSAIDAAALAPGVSMAVSAQELALLRLGFAPVYAGSAVADGRPAELIAVDRADGTLAARYWLDRQSGLPLRRQLFDEHGRIVSDIAVTDLQTGPGALRGYPAAAAAPWTRQLGGPAIAALRARGWPLPERLPGGMTLVTASEVTAPDGPVIGLSYSDGLSVVSLFVQRGVLPGVPAAWQPVAIGGQHAYAVDPDGQMIVWPGDGYVYTMIADAPAAIVDQVVAALPHASKPGLWARLERGFLRLASWANPFR